MYTKPKSLKYLAGLLLLTAISFPVQIMILYNHAPTESGAILAKISDLNWVVIFLCLLTALFVDRAAAASRVFAPILLVTVGVNNGFVSAVGDDYSQGIAYLATLLFFLAHTPLMNPEIKMLLKNPQSRWWLTPIRKRLELPMMLSPFNHQAVFRSRTFDLSKHGAFVPFSKTLDPLTELKVNDSLFLCLNLGTLTQLRCQARVVRINKANGFYPAGIGLSFTGLGLGEKRKLNKCIKASQAVV
jgi:hypothetical protein